ncbi:MAG: SDR family oxidoreductase, partial [Rhodospirillales bacterium]
MSGLVAVTGATGFVGRHLVAQLLADGWQVRALVRRPDQELESAGVQTISGSLEDAPSLSELVSGADALIHGAG